jgi:hypothetical protein
VTGAIHRVDISVRGTGGSGLIEFAVSNLELSY